MNDTPEITEAAPPGCAWKIAKDLALGDEMFLGKHRIFGSTESYFGEITEVVEKPKTFIVTFRPTHEKLYGQQSTTRIRKDEMIAVRER